jgi:hypothetical protein
MERGVVHAPRDPRYNALAPWLLRLRDGALLVVFTTDEDRAEPGVPATGVLEQSVKCLLSGDVGQSWMGPPEPQDTGWPLYFPGACPLRSASGEEGVLVQYTHRYRGGFTRRAWPAR